MKIGPVLQAVRHRAGFTQEEMAHRMHMSQSCISKIEKDRKMIDFHTITRWTEVTNAKEVVIAYLCGIDGVSIMQNILQMFGG